MKPNLKPLLEYRNTRCFLCDTSDQLSRGAEGVMGKCAPKVKVKAKSKVYPRTDHKDPEGKQMYSFTLPFTSALDGVGWSTPRLGRFSPWKDPVPIV